MNFNEIDYLEIINEKIELNKAVIGYKTLMAKACGCQKSYLSQVLRGQTHLTLDHGYGLSDFFQLTELEKEYFLTLLQIQRSGSLEFKNYLEGKLKDLRKKNDDFASKFKSNAPTTNSEHLSKYYSNWHYNAIHMICGIEEFRSVEAIAKKLKLSEKLVQTTLEELQEMGLVKKENHLWINTDNYLHLPKESPYHRLNHTLWRQKATENTFLADDNLNYTAIYTLSKEDSEELRGILKKAIDKTRDVVIKSEEEDIVCLNIDYFKL